MADETSRKAGGTRRPLERVLRIHEMVSRGRLPNANEMARELEVNRKTILRDIRFMRDDLELPLVYDESRHGYFYSRPVNEFPLLQTSADDLVGLILARNALGPMKGSALESTLRSSFQRLQATMSDQVTIPWSEIDQAFSVKSTGITERDVFVFERLAKAVLESRELHFDYRKLSDEKPMKRRLQPYHLAEIDGGWYIIGQDLERGARRTFAVQRMKSVHLTETRFQRSHDFRLDDHFAGSFGVWAGEGQGPGHFEVKVRFSGFAARVVAERRWHPSQEIENVAPDGSLIVLTLQLSALEDIARWILGFGSQAQVMAPPELVERVSSELKRAAAQY
ncbi:MAG: WYL domain-containing transcriptional regulator [Verrucomicrobiales bacterium]|nr:transcriptional regulator [bacterium]MDF2375714.1 WYL domain-containing transcriptional regulator [Verrucomicrobiales bacterium]